MLRASHLPLEPLALLATQAHHFLLALLTVQMLLAQLLGQLVLGQLVLGQLVLGQLQVQLLALLGQLSLHLLPPIVGGTSSFVRTGACA